MRFKLTLQNEKNTDAFPIENSFHFNLKMNVRKIPSLNYLKI